MASDDLFRFPLGSIEYEAGALSNQLYARKLTSFLDEERAKIARDDGTHDREEDLALHRACLDRIVDRLPAYGPLLATIKAEYEKFIDALRLGERNSFYLETKLRNLDGEEQTSKNYKKRCKDIERKIKIVEKDNQKIKDKIKCLQGEREEREAEIFRLLLGPAHLSAEMTAEKRLKVLHKVTLDQSTNIRALEKELSELETKIAALREAENKRFVAKSHKDDLLRQLEKKEMLRETVLRANEDLKRRLYNLRMAVEATFAYNDNMTERRLSFSDVVEKALSGQNFKKSLTQDQTPLSSSVEDDDPAKEKETQMILEYIERWHELLGDEKYEAAAIYAANSPKGVLRNSETLDSFKNVKHSSGLKSPLLTYCEILLSTVTDTTMRPSKADSVECVRCALEHGKIDLVAHWLATDVLECSALLGALIEKHAAQTDDPRQLRLMYSLASTAYTRAEYYKQAAVAMCRQGRYYGMLSFARETGSFKSEDYLAVLRAVPHLKLGLLLVDCPSLPVKEVFGVFQLETRRDFIRALANKKDLMDLMQKDSETSLSDWMTIVSACEEENQWDEAVEILACVTVTRVLRTRQR